MNKELELEAEKLRQNQYIDNSITTWTKNDWQSCWKEGFISGATSDYVEKQKLEFAIEQLNKIQVNVFAAFAEFEVVKSASKMLSSQIQKLEQELEELCNIKKK